MGDPTMRVQSPFAARALFSVAWLLVGTATALPASESEPTLPTKDLVPASVALSGSGYAVNSPAHVKNFLGQFSISSDWGEIDAAGGVLLALRIAEMPALAELDKVTHSKVFADAIAESASKTITGVVRVASDPEAIYQSGRLYIALRRALAVTVSKTDDGKRASVDDGAGHCRGLAQRASHHVSGRAASVATSRQ